MKYYMKVTNDKYELPIAVAESPGELAQMLGVTKGTVLASIGHHYANWIRLEIEDEEELEKA